MEDLVGRGQGCIEIEFADVRIYQQMMMTRVVEFDSCRGHTQALETESYGDWSVHDRAVLGRDKIHFGGGGRRHTVLCERHRRQCAGRQRRNETIHRSSMCCKLLRSSNSSR